VSSKTRKLASASLVVSYDATKISRLNDMKMRETYEDVVRLS
jgi:hypothetical protein